jgi:hypothetical protein
MGILGKLGILGKKRSGSGARRKEQSGVCLFREARPIRFGIPES